MVLSVCILPRNEEKNIARAIGSVAGVADEVIVADTGSTDRTVETAQELGAKVKHCAWNDDFAAARDFAIGQASGDWILWLNPDEELISSTSALLRQHLQAANVLGYYLRVEEIPRADQPSAFSETVQLRLFRRHPELRSVGRLHPSFVPSLEELARREGKGIAPVDVTLRRHAYLSQMTEPKLRWALRLLELELKDRPGQLHYLIEYGRTLLLLNEGKGHWVLAEAADQIWSRRNDPAAPAPDVQRLLEYLITVAPEYSRSKLVREDALELARRWFPQSPPLLWRCAEYFFQRQDFKEASEFLERLVQCGKTGVHDRTEAFDPEIIGEVAIMNLGACYLRLGNLDGAEGCFLQLLGRPGFREKAGQYLAMAQAQRAQTGQRR